MNILASGLIISWQIDGGKILLLLGASGLALTCSFHGNGRCTRGLGIGIPSLPSYAIGFGFDQTQSRMMGKCTASF